MCGLFASRDDLVAICVDFRHQCLQIVTSDSKRNRLNHHVVGMYYMSQFPRFVNFV